MGSNTTLALAKSAIQSLTATELAAAKMTSLQPAQYAHAKAEHAFERGLGPKPPPASVFNDAATQMSAGLMSVESEAKLLEHELTADELAAADALCFSVEEYAIAKAQHLRERGLSSYG